MDAVNRGGIASGGVRGRRVWGFIAGTIWGLLAAFFFVFRTLFTDHPGDPLHPEMLFAQAVTLLAYLAPVAILVRWIPAPTGTWALTVGWPAAVVLLAYQDPPAWMTALTAGAVLLGLTAGEAAAYYPRRRRAGTGCRSRDA